MSKVKGYLNISLAWDDEEFGDDCVTPEQVLEFLPEGVNCSLYIWDDEEKVRVPSEKFGEWVLLSRNWEDEDKDLTE